MRRQLLLIVVPLLVAARFHGWFDPDNIDIEVRLDTRRTLIDNVNQQWNAADTMTRWDLIREVENSRELLGNRGTIVHAPVTDPLHARYSEWIALEDAYHGWLVDLAIAFPEDIERALREHRFATAQALAGAYLVFMDRDAGAEQGPTLPLEDYLARPKSHNPMGLPLHAIAVGARRMPLLRFVGATSQEPSYRFLQAETTAWGMAANLQRMAVVDVDKWVAGAEVARAPVVDVILESEGQRMLTTTRTDTLREGQQYDEYHANLTRLQGVQRSLERINNDVVCQPGTYRTVVVEKTERVHVDAGGQVTYATLLRDATHTATYTTTAREYVPGTCSAPDPSYVEKAKKQLLVVNAEIAALGHPPPRPVIRRETRVDLKSALGKAQATVFLDGEPVPFEVSYSGYASATYTAADQLAAAAEAGAQADKIVQVAAEAFRRMKEHHNTMDPPWMDEIPDGVSAAERDQERTWYQRSWIMVPGNIKTVYPQGSSDWSHKFNRLQHAQTYTEARARSVSSAVASCKEFDDYNGAYGARPGSMQFVSRVDYMGRRSECAYLYEALEPLIARGQHAQ